LRHQGNISVGEFDVLHTSGHRIDAEWLFDGSLENKCQLFASGPLQVASYRDKQNIPPYCSAYHYYTQNSREYARATFLKCDDDIVFIDLETLKDFVSYRKTKRDFFLISANVINNGVCAHYQQALGNIPRDVLELELPRNGLFGSLWESAEKAETLHRYFVENHSRLLVNTSEHFLKRMGISPIVEWNSRISINFISWLGEDLPHIPYVLLDDEHELCNEVRARTRKPNCIFLPFVVSHLSFYSQDKGMNINDVLSRYERLADGLLPPGQRLWVEPTASAVAD